MGKTELAKTLAAALFDTEENMIRIDMSEYQDAASDGEIKPDARERVLAEMRLHFRPEFLNRLDDIVLFKPLTQAEIETRIGRALLSGDILDGAVIRIGYADGELTVGYDNPAYENAA